MKKIKMFTGKKRCPDGETYSFRNGVATVPGFRLNNKQVLITIVEFNKLSKMILSKIKALGE